jgi:hypothetical protein
MTMGTLLQNYDKIWIKFGQGLKSKTPPTIKGTISKKKHQ